MPGIPALLRRAPTVLAGLALLLILLGLLGRVPMLLDALSAFLIQLTALAAAAALWALLRRRFLALVLALAAIGLAAIGAPQALRDAKRPAAERPVRPLVIATANVFYGNTELPALSVALETIDADILVTIETPLTLWEEPGTLATRYPYRRLTINSGRGWGVAVWSKLPFAEGVRPHLGGNPRHVIVGLDLGDGGPPLRVMGLHMDWPVFGAQARAYDDFDRFWRMFRPPGQTVIAGDFNAAPWSSLIARVSAVSGTRPVDGLRMTWRGGVGGRAGRFFVPGGLPIDHVLLSDGIGVRGAWTLALPGSDHRAVIVEAIVPLLSESAASQTVDK